MGNGAMALVIFVLAGPAQPWLVEPALLRILHLFLIIFAGLATYVLLLALMGIRIRHFRAPS